VAATTSRTAKKTVAKKTVAKRAVVRKPRKTAASASVLTAHQEQRAYIPDPVIAEQYVGRQINGVWDFTIAEVAYEECRNMLLMGETGSGKTLFGEAWAAKMGLPYYSLPCDISIDTTAITGKLQPTEIAGLAEWMDGPLAELIRGGGVFNVSEGNMMSAKIAAVLYPVLDGRRYLVLLGHKGEVLRAHVGTQVPDGKGGFRKCWCDLDDDECNSKRILVVMDLNPNYRGTVELNAAFLNRFDFKIQWNYDPAVEEKLIQWPTVRAFAVKLRDMHGKELVTPVSTNMLMEFEKFANNARLGTAFAIENFVSAFRLNEREPVKKVIELMVADIEKDKRYFNRLGKKGRKVETDDELEELEYEAEDED
jgi:MoxR-like ATPase